MKKIKIFLVLALIVGVFNSCSKSSIETKANYSDADILLNQVKQDTNFIKYMITIDKFAQMAVNNAIQHPRPDGARVEDSMFMRNKTVPLKEKFEKMNYDGYSVTMQMIQENYNNYTNLKKRYPLWSTLNDVEKAKFLKLANEYYIKNIKTIK